MEVAAYDPYKDTTFETINVKQLWNRPCINVNHQIHHTTCMLPCTKCKLCVCHVPGPLASYLGEKYGLRLTVIVGGFLAGVGLLISSYASGIYTLYLSYGILTGNYGNGL